MKKNVVPGNASLSAEQDAWFEEMEERAIERLPATVWEQAPAFWDTLPRAFPATQYRLIARLLAKLQKCATPPPQKLVDWFVKHVPETARGRTRSPFKLQEAARFKARNPGATLLQIATAIGMPGKKTTILNYTKTAQFRQYLSDEQFLIDLEQGSAARARAATIRDVDKEPTEEDVIITVHQKRN